jgi:hypothetical protein
MANKTLIFGILAIIVIAGIVAIFALNKNTPTLPTPTPSQDIILVKQSDGQGMLIAECGDRSYITNTSDYIVEGVVNKAEARWNEQKNFINTYVDFSIEKYVKGNSFGDKLQLQVGSGCVDGICQNSEDEATFKEGDHLRLYFHKTETEFWIVCAQFGVEQI